MRWEPLLPWWGVLLLLLPLIAFTIYMLIKQLQIPKTHRQWKQVLRLSSLIILLLLAGLGPSVPGDRSPAGMINLDVVVVIDRTPSMSAEDYDTAKQRLDGVRSDVKQLATALSGARISIVTFGETAQVVLPFTTDTASIIQASSVLDQEISLYVKGTTIDRPIEAAQKLLTKSQHDHPTRGRLLFYLGDGEQTIKQAPKSFAQLKPLISGGAVLGYGTSTGGNMPLYFGYRLYTDDTAPKKYIDDLTMRGTSEYVKAVSKIDETNLKTIASDLGLKYQHRENLSQPISSVVDASRARVVGDSHRETLHYMNLYWALSLPIVGLVVWWLYDLLPVRRQARNTKEQSS